MNRLITFLFATTLICVALLGCASAEVKDEPAQSEDAILDVGHMSVYCLVRGKILALVAIDKDNAILAGACADPPQQELGDPKTKQKS